MASATESQVIAVLALLLVSSLVLLLVHRFLPLGTAPAVVTIPVFLGLTLPATVILLVPIDLASSAQIEDEAAKGIWLSERMVLVAWRISYWLTFLLTWFILPFLGDYMDAGFRDSKQRVLYSLRSNGRYQLIVMGCALAGLIYISIFHGFNFDTIKALIMAFAYVWGLVLAIYLMGHGLVAVPRRMFRNANLSTRLRRLQSHAPRVNEKLEDAVLILEEIEGQVGALKQRKSGTAHDYREWIDELVETASPSGPRAMISSTIREAAAKVPVVITERYLADLTRRLDRARRQRIRYIEEWDNLVHTASDIQTIMDSKLSQRLTFGRSSPNTSLFMRYSPLNPYLRYHLHVHVIPGLLMCLGSTLAIASLSIIWSEIVKFPLPRASAISLTVIHQPNNKSYQIGFGGQLTAAAWILYMSACALTSVSDVPVWNQRALIKNHTSAESACWYASQIAKLTVPLSYNVLTMLPVHIHQSTTFYHFLGRLINLTPLGTGFDYLFPIFILVPACATFFNLYGRIKNILGFGILEDEDEDNENSNTSGFYTRGWREGRDLIARDLAGHGGANNNSLGLLDSAHPKLESRRTPRRAIGAASSSATAAATPPTPLRTTNGSSPSPYPTSRQQQQPQPPNRHPHQQGRLDLDPSPEDENIFTLFGKRVKNAIDTIDTPRWMQQQPSSTVSDGSTDATNPLFMTPRWMTGAGAGGNGNGNGGVSGFRRVFGGAGSPNMNNTNNNNNNNRSRSHNDAGNSGSLWL